MGQRIDELLEATTICLDALGSIDLDGLVDADLESAVTCLQQQRSRLEAAEARLLDRWESSRVWQESGAKSPAAWLAWRQRIPIQIARQRMRHAREVRDLPAISSAWAAGEIDRSHVATILGARNPRTETAFLGDGEVAAAESGHEVLLDHARSMPFSSFKRICDRWQIVVDPDGAEQRAEANRAARDVSLAQSLGDMYYGRVTLDPVSGQVVADTLAAIERELFEADWAAAKHRLGRKPLVHELGRTSGQRRADALVEMAVRARTAPRDGNRPRPLFTVVVGLETLQGPILELLNRTTLAPGTVVPWLSEADVERIVFDPPSRVVDVGSKRRFFRGALRRALEVRDRTCFHPSCDEVPQRPEADHIDPVSEGGDTTQTNGRWGCGFHNRWRQAHPDQDDDPHH